MRLNSTATGLLTWAVLAAAAGYPVRAQDGVAGAAPVFSAPKRPPPDEKSARETLNKIQVQSPLVTAPVTVLDASGEFVYDLEEADFRVLDNGVPQRLERFEAESRPMAVVIVIQTNRAVAPLFDQVRPLGPVLSTLLLGEQGKAAVIFFDEGVRVAQEFSSDSARLAATLHGFTASGDKARLNDALLRAIQLLEKRPREERRVVVAFADGFDSGSETGKEEIVGRATSAEVGIYGLGFNPTEALLAQKPEPPPPGPLETNVTRPLPPGVTPTPTASQNVYGTPVPVVPILIATGEIIRSASASSLLEYYAGYTGGVFYSHWSQKALERQLTKVASEINSQYELAYAPDTLEAEGLSPPRGSGTASGSEGSSPGRLFLYGKAAVDLPTSKRAAWRLLGESAALAAITRSLRKISPRRACLLSDRSQRDKGASRRAGPPGPSPR